MLTPIRGGRGEHARVDQHDGVFPGDAMGYAALHFMDIVYLFDYFKNKPCNKIDTILLFGLDHLTRKEIMFINAESYVFVSTEERSYKGSFGIVTYNRICGTVEVTIGRDTKRVECIRDEKTGLITAYGVNGKYKTGGKVWAASISQAIQDGKIFERVRFGRDDRALKFKKENCIFFAK